jgi:hypothetical protein
VVDRLDVVAVGVVGEGGVVAGVVVARARPAVVAPAIGQGGGVEALDGRLVGGLEGQVHVAGRLADVDPQLVGIDMVAGPGDAALDERHADRLEHGLVEPLHGRQVLGAQVDVVDQAAAMELHGRAPGRMFRDQRRGARRSFHARGAHAPAAHAGVAGLDDHGHAQGLEIVPQAIGDLRRKPLLHLQSPGEAVQHPRQLGDPHHPVARQVGDVRLADDRGHVVLAVRLERDVLQQHDVVIAAHLLEHPRQVPGGILAIALAIFLPGPRHPRRGVDQPLARRILAGPAQQGADGVLHVLGDRRLGGRGREGSRRSRALISLGFGLDAPRIEGAASP